MTALSLLGKSIGFLVPFFIAIWFGVNSETDAFFLAYGTLLFVAGVLGTVIEILVPFIAEFRAKEEEMRVFIGKLLGNGSVILLLVVGLLLVGMKPVLAILTDLDPSTLALTYQLFIEISPLGFILLWTSILSGFLNAHKQFNLPALSPAFRAIVSLGMIFLFQSSLGVHAISLGYVAGEFVRLLILALVTKEGYRVKFSISFRPDSKLIEFYKTSLFASTGMVFALFNRIIDRIMASWLPEGSISILHYADSLFMIPVSLFSTGLMTIFLSYWSENYYGLERNKFKQEVGRVVKVVVLITLPVTFLLIIIRDPLVRFIFGRGAFERQMLPEVGKAWAGYLIGLMPYGVTQVYVKAHVVLKNTRPFIRGEGYIAVLNILLNYCFMKYLGVSGIPLATSCTSLFGAIYYWLAFERRWQRETCVN